ncbi:hypothetical protein BDW72DRAFT_183120 [Aspergillus terricola var. indicus]
MDPDRYPFNLAKEREFYRYLPRDHSSYPYAPFDDSSRKAFIPAPSQDHTLTSFAQLGAMRLGAQRAIISLFGPTNQYILAEATGSPDDELRLGCCVLPRENSIFPELTNTSPDRTDTTTVHHKALIIPDLQVENKDRYAVPKQLYAARFYAGVPIISPRGQVIGSYGVLDSQPRPSGVDESTMNFMKDMATTIMRYLDTMHLEHENTQARKMITGLGSFVEGKSTLRDSWLESNEQDAARGRLGDETVEGLLDKRQQDLQEARDNTRRQLPYRPARNDSSGADDDEPDARPGKHKRQNSFSQKGDIFRSEPSGENLPDDEGSQGVLQEIFSRAANLIRESIAVEGVVFFDARVESFGGLVGYEYREDREARSESETTASSEESPDPGLEEGATICRILGSSTSFFSTINADSRSGSKATRDNDFALHEFLLKAMMNRYPRGKIFNYNNEGSLSDESGSNRSIDTSKSVSTKDSRRRKRSHKQDANDLHRVLHGPRSIIFLPLWDSHKSRWLSGLLVWTNTPQRIFTAETELVYLRAFANSIMAAVHKLDIEMADKAKTNLVSNISHELRSPLHGILGTADLLSDTALNALQYGMVHTLEACGRTLLDTINHLLDFTYIDKFRKDRDLKHKDANKSEVSGQDRDTLERNPPNSSENINTDVQLDAVLEEVVESIFAGHTFYHQARRNGGSPKTTVVSTKQVTIIFDIQESDEWRFYTQAGCWRRILLNIFSNALKYTQQGFVYIGLKVAEAETPPRESNDSSHSDANAKYTVTLVVKDTGQGIGPTFLRNGLFVPFSQEDALAPGSGLGLSIVRKAVTSLHGTIELSSEKDKGTEVTVQVPMRPVSDSFDESSTTAAYRSIRKKAQGKTLGLVGFGSSLASERDATLSSSLTRLCEDWFHLTVKRTNLNDDPPAACDFYLLVHTDLDDPDAEGNQVLDLAEPSKLSPLIVICHCPEAAHKLYARSASMRHHPKPIVEFISQPCGPRKLAKSMELCLKRMEGQEPDQHEETRWVELPESSHLPLDIGPRDAPDERMKVSKRLAEEKNDEQHSRKPINDGPSLPDGPGTGSGATVPDVTAENDPPSVLLVEDNPINLDILVAYTKKEGWSSTIAQNGLEAFEKFQEHPGKFALIIIDISMPVMNGFEASQRIRQFERKYFDAHPELKPSWHPTTIVALTGLDSEDAQHEAFASGINVFLTKPISRAKIRTLLGNL